MGNLQYNIIYLDYYGICHCIYYKLTKRQLNKCQLTKCQLPSVN